jgi:hypothetical protein
VRKAGGRAVAALVILGATVVHGTQLRVRARNHRGDAVRFTAAELLPVRANEPTDPVPLSVGDGRLVLDLDEGGLRRLWPGREDAPEGVYLYLEARGYAPVQSEEFHWLGAPGPTSGSRLSRTEIAFQSGERVTVGEGEDAELELTLREPGPRSLRLVDDRGKAVQGVRVTSFVFWSAWNHCGVLSGVKRLGEHASDAEGRVPVEDGDLEYAFLLGEILERHYGLKDAASFVHRNWEDADEYFVTRLHVRETTVRLHRHRAVPLNLRVSRNGIPAREETLWGQPAACHCAGDCVVSVATTDKDGRIRISEFYPEEWAVIFLGNNDERLWEVYPDKLPSTGVVPVDLGTRTPSTQP